MKRKLSDRNHYDYHVVIAASLRPISHEKVDARHVNENDSPPSEGWPKARGGFGEGKTFLREDPPRLPAAATPPTEGFSEEPVIKVRQAQ